MRVMVVQALGLLALTSCSSLMQPRLMRHYTAYEMKEAEGGDPEVRLSAFTLTPPSTAARDIFNLSAEGQAAAITVLGSKIEDPTAFIQALAGRVQENRQATQVDLTTLKRRVVFSIENTSVSPSDRLSWARLVLRLPPGSGSFVGWDKVATERQTVDLGTLTFTQSHTLGLEAGGMLSFGSVAPKATTSTTAGVQEVVPVRRRYITLSGALTPQTATLLQQTSSGEDLTGNVVVDLEMKLASAAARWIFSVSHPRKSDGTTDCSAKPVLSRQMVTFPRNASGPLKATAELEYVLRRVVNGHQSQAEGDDRVQFIYGTVPLPEVELAPAGALRFDVSVLEFGGELLHAKPVGVGHAFQMDFATADDGIRLANWIAVCGVDAVSGYQLLLGATTALPNNDKRSFAVKLIPQNTLQVASEPGSSLGN